MNTLTYAFRDGIRSLMLAGTLLLSLIPPKSNSTSIFDPASLSMIETTTVSFEDLAGYNGQQFGFVVGQPYTSLGLTMGQQAVVEAADIGSLSGGIAVRSASVYTVGFVNWQPMTFGSGQRGVGFYVRDSLATSLTIEAYDASHNLLESSTLTASSLTRYAGVLRTDADIFRIEIRAPHLTAEDAMSSRTFIDDVSFGFVEIPEPSAIALMGVGAVSLLVCMKRR